MKSTFDLTKYIEPIELNGLHGRVVNAPATTKSAAGVNILFIQGHHTSHERITGVIELMQRYGNVCTPDLPGFGGMDSMLNIGLKPSVDNLADYLDAFIKLQYGTTKKFVIIGYSMGFMVVTRMLQKYPSLHKQVLGVVSIAGIVHGDEFVFSKNRRLFYLSSAFFLGLKIPAFITKFVFLRKWFLGTIYTKLHNSKEKFQGLDAGQLEKFVDFEVKLWRENDVRTWSYTSMEMLNANLVSGSKMLPLSIESVVINADRYFSGIIVNEHLKILYKIVNVYTAKVKHHGGSIVETARQAEEFIPNKLRDFFVSLR